MQLNDKIIVITGGGSGIGKAMAQRFLAESPKQIVLLDINADNVKTVAESLGCVGMQVDVSDQTQISDCIDNIESQIGPVDLFCSNAGVGLAPELDSAASEWQMSWDINVMSHVFAAQKLVPLMVARGGGYFLNTSSAAGLLNQIGGAAYAVTKHAAVGFAEWLLIHHAHLGIKVSLLCPQAVRTPMTESAHPSVAAAAVDGMMEPGVLAESVVEGLHNEQFLILPHAEVLEYMRRKTSDYDRWLDGMNRLMRKLSVT